jgi:hypothetical protein
MWSLFTGDSVISSRDWKTRKAIITDYVPTQCEKHARKEEAMEKLRNGTKFDEVAREFSEDKARQGMFNILGFNGDMLK